MQPASEAYRTAISQPGRRLRAHIILGDHVIDNSYIQLITYKNGCMNDTDFQIGTAVMAKVDVELLNKDGSLSYPFEDQEALINIGVMLADSSHEDIPLGFFTFVKPKRTGNKIKLTGWDRMYRFDKQYESTLEYPATLLQIAQDICAKAGVPFKNTIFVNSDYTVPNKPVLEGITCRKAIAQVAELAGGYARITRDGQLEIYNISSVPVAAISKRNYFYFTNKDLPQAAINKIIIKIGAEEASAGTGTNPLYIINNMFCQNPNNAVNAIFEVLNGVAYMPYTMKWQGNPALDCGDLITVNTDKGVYTTVIGNRILTYSGGLREEYSAPGKSNTEKSSTSKGSLTLAIENVLTEIKVLDGKIEQRVLKEDFNDLGERVETTESLIAQHSNEIALRVTETVYQQGIADAKSYADSKAVETEAAAKAYTDANITYKVDIISTNGNLFKNGDINTRLFARVYHGKEDITDQIDETRFRWTRVSDDPLGDERWNNSHFGGTKWVDVTSEDVHVRATFICEILDF